MQPLIGGVLLTTLVQLCVLSSAKKDPLNDLENRYSSEWHFQRKAKFFYDQSLAKADNSFLYALCKDLRGFADFDCEVTIEKPLVPDNTTRVLTCPLRLHPEHGGVVLSGPNNQPFLQLTQLGEKRAIVSWREVYKNKGSLKQRLRISIVDLAKCLNSHIKIPIVAEQPFLGNVVVYGDRYFEVIATNPELCWDSQKCRILFDAYGTQVGDPVPFESSFQNVAMVKTVAANKRSKGYLVFGEKSGKELEAQLVSANGTVVKNLLTINETDEIVPTHKAISTAHELLTIGWISTNGDKIHAAQFDAEGNLKVNLLLDHKVEALEWLVVHSLAEGGFLMIGSRRDDDYPFDVLRVVRVHKDGSLILMNKILESDVKCSKDREGSGLSVDVREDDHDVCFYFACARQQFEKGLQVSVRAKFNVKCMRKDYLGL